MKTGKLIFFCGKMGAGKTTRAREIVRELKGVLFSEDEWLGSVFPNRIQSLRDYVSYSNLLKPQIKKTVQDILRAGVSVVMDFPGNTSDQRAWLKTIYAEVNAPHELVYLDVPDAICLSRIRLRRQDQPERAETDTQAMFEQVTKYFEPPNESEGFNVNRQASDA